MRKCDYDIIGKNFGLWTILEKTSIQNSNRSFLWRCKCACGTERLLQIYGLIIGTSKGCGCKLTDDEARFKIFCKKYTIKENGCWIWNGNINEGGYGRINHILAHRYSYERFKGPIPKGMCVCHNCPEGDNPLCVNPDHLWLGTPADNMRDKRPKGRQTCGELSKQAKLTGKNVKKIKKRLKKGETLHALAKEFNVSHGLISHIKQGRAWTHI